MNMQRKIKKVIIIVVVLCVIGILVGKHMYSKSEIKFKDKNMENVMVGSCERQSGDYTRSHENLDKLKYLTIGFVGYYDTLEDIKWGKNIEQLQINVKTGEYDYEPVYEIAQGKIPQELTQNKVSQFEKELENNLPKLKKLREIYVVSDYGCEWNSLDFLEGCDQVEEITLGKFKITDYSVLKQCKSLRKITFFDCPISKADDLIGLEHLEWIGISGTPLAQDEEEMKKLKEAYPNAEYR